MPPAQRAVYGRTCCIGIEDTCAYHAEGLRASVRRNPIRDAGIPTSVNLSRRKTVSVRHIQGVASIPRGFDRVRGIAFSEEEVVFSSRSGAHAAVRVRPGFLRRGADAWATA